jgi:hypothetical protein
VSAARRYIALHNDRLASFECPETRNTTTPGWTIPSRDLLNWDLGETLDGISIPAHERRGHTGSNVPRSDGSIPCSIPQNSLFLRAGNLPLTHWFNAAIHGRNSA